MNSKTRILFEDLEYFDINTYKETEKLPFSIKILLENLIYKRYGKITQYRHPPLTPCIDQAL